MTLLCGIDDSGRGPVIGPMVMAGTLIDEENLSKLENLKVKDSKLLSAKRRDFLFNRIIKVVKAYEIIVINVEEVGNSVNLNDLEAVKSGEIINILNPDKAIIDCPSPNIKAWKEQLRGCLNNKKIELVVEHKSEKYPSVAAASILAKVTRDREIEEIKKKYKVDFGSGYMSDPKTKKFLEENFEKYEKIFRKNWAPYKDKVNGKKQRSLGEF